MASHHPAFELLSDREIPEFRARGLLFRHKATGCEVYRLVSEDEENSFAFALRPPPPGSRGVAHIVEHSVLCGSERYPVKDAFLVMARRSLATFLNAWTYPDKTVYPAASAAPADYFNLLSVYGDAVFFPRLSEDTFLQEAHHLELSEEGSLDVMVMVYNEMRGDYSSAESLAATAAATSLFSPGHPYSFDSGGDPAAIPSLSYEAFKEFWAACYHPSNCRIFLHGNIDTERQLAFLEERFLGRAEPGKRFAAREPSPEIPFEPPFAAPRRLEVPCPASEGSEGATTIIVNWLSRPAADAAEALALEVLSEILLGHDGAPLSMALRDSGLGEDLSPQSGLDSSYRQAIFTAGLRGARRGDEARIEELVVGTVRSLAAEGFKAEALEAALHSIAFANKEIRRGSGTYGLRLMNRALRGWLHGAHPEESLSFGRPLAVLKDRLAAEPRYLEGLALALVADNPHRSTVTVYPDPGLFERREAERRAALAAKAASLTKAELERVGERAARLAEEQDRADPPELLALLPRLEVKDIPRTIDIVPREKASVLGRPASLHPLFTNGIVYLDLAFPLDGLPRGDYLWLPLLSRFIAGAGLPGLPYDRVAERLARTAGGFGASLDSGSPLRRAADGRIEADALAGAAAIMGEKRIEEGKKRIDRVERRPAGAAAPAQFGIRRADQVVEDGEIDVRRLALRAAQDIQRRIGQFDAPQDVGQPFRRLRQSLPVGGIDRLAMVAQCAHQHGALVGDLAQKHGAHDLLRHIGRTILRAPQQHVAGHRPFHARLEAAVALQQHQRDAGACAGRHQRRRDVDGTEHHDRGEHVERHAGPLRPVHLGHEIFAVLAQRGAFRSDVDCVEELLHGTSASSPASARLRQALAGLATASGRHSSASEQARQRWRCRVGGGVTPAAKTSARAAAASSVNRRRSASNGTATRRRVCA